MCDSPVAPQEKATNHNVNTTGSLTLLSQLERKADYMCPKRRGQTPFWKLQKNPEIPASTPDEDLSPGRDWRGILRGPSQLAWRLDFPEATGAGP